MSSGTAKLCETLLLPHRRTWQSILFKHFNNSFWVLCWDCSPLLRLPLSCRMKHTIPCSCRKKETSTVYQIFIGTGRVWNLYIAPEKNFNSLLDSTKHCSIKLYKMYTIKMPPGITFKKSISSRKLHLVMKCVVNEHGDLLWHLSNSVHILYLYNLRIPHVHQNLLSQNASISELSGNSEISLPVICCASVFN